MSVDGSTERAAIKTRLSGYLLNGRVYTSLPEERRLEIDSSTGLIKPYILLHFGSLYPQADDQSIEGADQQPQIWPIIVECWAADADSAMATAGAVRTRLLGWAPGSGNASEMDLRGGGWFEQKDSTGRPTRYMESVNFEMTINNSILAP